MPITQGPLVNTAPWIETCEDFQANAASAVAVANDANLYRIRARLAAPILVARIRLYVVVSGGNVDGGLWSYDGTTWTLLGSSGSTAVGSINTVQTLTVTAPPSANPNAEYYLGFAADGTTATFQRSGSTAAGVLAAGPGGPRCVAKASSFPLATNAASFVSGDTKTPQTVVHWLRGSAT